MSRPVSCSGSGVVFAAEIVEDQNAALEQFAELSGSSEGERRRSASRLRGSV